MQNKQNGGCRSRLGCFVRALLLVAIGIGIGSFAVSHNLSCLPAAGAYEWVSPDYHYMTDWDDIAYSYDDNLNTYAYDTTPAHSWSDYLHLEMLGGQMCSKVRLWAYCSPALITTVTVDVYDIAADEWLNIYSGTYTYNAWTEISIGEALWTSGVRFKFYNNTGGTQWPMVKEVDFYVVTIPDTLILEPESDINYIGDNHTLTAVVYDNEDSLMAGIDVEWSIIDGMGEIVAYDGSTDENGQAEATITSDMIGATVVKCVVTDYPDVYDTAVKGWDQNWLDIFIDWLAGQNYTTMQSITLWLESHNYTTTEDVEAWAEENNVVMGGIGMPLWYLFGLAALAAGAWWSRSMLVNIMVAAMAGAGIPLVESTLEAGSATYWGVYLVLILAVFYALIQIFTRVEHW